MCLHSGLLAKVMIVTLVLPAATCASSFNITTGEELGASPAPGPDVEIEIDSETLARLH